MERYLSLLSETDRTLFELFVSPLDKLPGFTDLRTSKLFTKRELLGHFNNLGELLMIECDFAEYVYGDQFAKGPPKIAGDALRAAAFKRWLLALEPIQEHHLKGWGELWRHNTAVVHAYNLHHLGNVKLGTNQEWNESVYRASATATLCKMGIQTLPDLVWHISSDLTTFSCQLLASKLPEVQTSYREIQAYLKNSRLPIGPPPFEMYDTPTGHFSFR